MTEITNYAEQEVGSYQVLKDAIAAMAGLGAASLAAVEELDAWYKALRNKIAEELSDDIREETKALKEAEVLEPNKFRPCRDAADQIDPRVPPEF